MSGELDSGPLRLAERDGGRKVPVAPGQRVVIDLPENPTTGHRWRVVTAGGLRVVEDENRAPGPGVGAASVRRLTFLAETTGTHEVRLQHCHLADPPKDDDPQFGVILEVG